MVNVSLLHLVSAYVLSAYEALKQSVIRYDLMIAERLFTTVTDMTQVDMMSRRVDLTKY